MPTVKQATPKDFPRIVELYEEGAREMGETDIDKNIVLKHVSAAYQLAPCFLLTNDDRIDGMAGFSVVASSHNCVATMIDYLFYIKSEYRWLKNLSALFEAAKTFAKEHKMPLRIEFSANKDEELRKRVLTMHGFNIHAVVGMYNPNGEE